MIECCSTCNKYMKLEKADYSDGGCKHSDYDGFACLAFADEGIVAHMVGVNPDKGMCELHSDRKPSAQPTIEERKWIPCSERLPEYDGDVYLVTDYCEQINRKRIHISYCYINKEGFWSDVPWGYKVIAWMPLPEPYREEGEE